MDSNQVRELESFLLKNGENYFDGKAKFLKVFGFVFIFIVFGYSFLNYLTQDYWPFILELMCGIAIAYAVIDLLKKNRLYPGVTIGISVGVVMIWQNFYSGGFENTGILWIYIAPLVTFFLVGSKKAIIYNIIMFLGLVVIYNATKIGIFPMHYSDFTVFMVFVSLSVYTLIVYVYQRSIENFTYETIITGVKVQETNKMRARFIDTIAHQLRTPLNIVRWNSEMLLDDVKRLNPEQKKLTKEVYSSSLEIISRLNEMLSAIEIRDSKTEIATNPILPIQIINETISTKKLIYPDRSVDVRNTGISAAEYILTDKHMFEAIIVNLIDNAFKYTKNNGIIDIEISKDARDFLFTIKDNGIGIPSKDSCNIANIFYRGANACKTNPNASGLGLYITKYYVDLLGGNLTFTSKLNKGTTFFLKLPLK